MWGFETTSAKDYLKIVRIDYLYNLVFTSAYIGWPNFQSFEVNDDESKIFALFRSTTFTIGVFNTTNGEYLQILASSVLSSNSIYNVCSCKSR